MSKQIKMIGQVSTKNMVNDILASREFKLKENEPFHWRAILLTGLTGLGKTHVAKAIAAALQEEDYNFAQLPVDAGWTEFGMLMSKVASFDDERGTASGIPYVIFIDEVQSQKTCLPLILKLLEKPNETSLIDRNGKKYFYDPANHLYVLATNHGINKALERRTVESKLVPYTQSEKKELIAVFAKQEGKEIKSDAVDFIENRVKPTAGEIEKLAYRIGLVNKETITLDDAKEVIRKAGLYPQGLDEIDRQLIIRIAQGNATAAVLKFIAQDDKKKDTEHRLSWLVCLGFLEQTKGGYTITKKGIVYFEAIEEAKKAARQKAKSKSKK